MEGLANSKIEKQSIYEIYRACRLCGAGAGYKMPIIQNVVDLDSGEVELKQKIRECVQIEVHQDDKMPPLICELCVDKVNDFFEFLEMCRQTNKQTRLRLGLPPQALPRGAPDAGDCILGVTEPIFIDNDDSNEPIARSKGKTVKSVKAKEPESRESRPKVIPKKDVKDIKKEGGKDRNESRALRRRGPSPPSPSPPRSLRGSKRGHEDDVSLSRLQVKSRRSDESPSAKPKSILKRGRESESEERTSTKVTRLREKENEKVSNEKINTKKVVKIMVKKEDLSQVKARVRSPSPPAYKCKVCKTTFESVQGLGSHMRARHPTKSKPVEETPSPAPKKEYKMVECRHCRKKFLNRKLMAAHTCSARSVKSKPATEDKPVKTEKPAPKPQRVSTPKKKDPVPIDPELLKQIRPLQVRISKCDPLLENKLGDHYDASDVDYDYGLDKTCVYPYIYTFRHMRIKTEPLYMVNIQDEIKSALDRKENYVHWDSDETNSDLELSDSKNVDTLTSISLKTLFSKKVLGKVPKKRRNANVEKAFDSILNASSDFDSDMRLGIDNIISSLDDDKDKSTLDAGSTVKAKHDKNDDNDSLFGDDNSPAIAITNDDFDSLFSSDTAKAKDKNKTDNKSEDGNTTNFSMDFTDGTDSEAVKTNDSSTVEDFKTLESKEFNKSDDSVKEDDISDAKNIQDDIDSVKSTSNDLDKNVSNKDLDISSKDNAIDGENESNKAITDENNSSNDKGGNLSTDDKGNSDKNSLTNDDTEKNSSQAKDSTLEADKEETNNDTHVNGQTALGEEFNMDDLEDVSDSEMEETSSTATRSVQIDEKGTANTKTDVSEKDTTVTEDSVVASVKSADLESISDGEFE